jgi:hypothetical protein
MSTTQTDQTQPAINWSAVAQDFKTQFSGKMEEPQLQAAVESIQASATNTAYAANGSVASLLFYMQFQVTINNGGKTFDGKAGGIAFPGGGALFGTVYTSDINALYSNTKSFQFTCTPVYTSLIFFDGSSNVLGTFQAGSVSTVTGTGGGSGHWS